MKKYGIRARKGVRVAEGPQDTWIVYYTHDGKRKTIEISHNEGKALKVVLLTNGITSEELRQNLGLETTTFNECLQKLRVRDLIEEVSVDLIKHSSDIGNTSMLVGDTRQDISSKKTQRNDRFKRIDRYTFLICNLRDMRWLVDLGLIKWLGRYNSYFLLPSILLCVFSLNLFYNSPSKALGNKFISEIFTNTSIVEVFGVFLVSQFITIAYKICVGLGKDSLSGALYLKMMGGFHPVFEASQDKQYDPKQWASKWEYLCYIASPQIMRANLLSLSVLLVYIGYPFATQLTGFALKILLINISVALITLFWAAFPSPGALSFKLMELYNIIPSRLVGLSVQKVFSGVKTESNRRYRLVLLLIALLLLVKVLYLLFFLLPEAIHDTPLVLGSWTPQILYITMVILAIKFIEYKYKSNSAKTPSQGSNNSQQLKLNRFSDDSRPSSATSSNNISVLESFNWHTFVRTKRNRLVAFALLILMIFPYASSVTGTAKINEKMSLDIKSSEKETSIVEKIWHVGPSAEIIKKGDILISMQSPSLESLINQGKDRVDSLVRSESIIKTEIQSLTKGSKYEESLNADDTVLQNVSDLDSQKYAVNSLKRQALILEDQVKTYRDLASKGALSEVQYQDKLVELEQKMTALKDSNSQVNRISAELTKSKRNKQIEQILSLSESLNTALDKLRSTQSDLALERKELRELERRQLDMIVKAPFDCVIDSDTSLLHGKKIAYGEQLLSVKSVPSEAVVISVPEYDRADVQIGAKVEARLYSKVYAELRGRVSSVSPVTTNSNDQEIVDVYISLVHELPSNFIGASGTGKIRSGWTCLLWNFAKPIVRFLNVDLWSILP
ncbi:HlyD family efflux transporter periplasmic adaptor subunit [Cyanobium sp. Aljojuca 7D2]|uniref:HlyD family secretion protein n=1 Tax=Cyanobium sp. Aljojuca 7D2 TaxID=2823698 RepID=UPI0020CE1C0E|nr:HlyD family efflux transporter periplasmic adaptor subunit [Cyanobium sp. Aljojuca 7D2]MCP9892149.1 HlyD family efflux transporter periplasmic adaptor subunit [Cyanobium sp. Aljojuca 7D2]